MERNRGYSSEAGLPFWSSYRNSGERPTSTPSCWMPCWLYTDSRKDWRPALGLMVNRMEKSSGKTPPEGGTSSRHVGWYVSRDQRICSYKNLGRCTFLSEVLQHRSGSRFIHLHTWELSSVTKVFLIKFNKITLVGMLGQECFLHFLMMLQRRFPRFPDFVLN